MALDAVLSFMIHAGNMFGYIYGNMLGICLKHKNMTSSNMEIAKKLIIIFLISYKYYIHELP